MINKHILRYILIFFVLLIPLNTVFAQSTPPSSTNYKIYNYGFGGGGTASSSSTNYSLFGSAGQVDQASSSSTNYLVEGGLEFTVMASAPAAPTFTNPSNWYNKLKIVINRGGNDPSDYKYAIAIASGSGTFQYVQSDTTVSSAFPLSAWQTYSQWGGTSGTNIIGLYPGTTYTVKVAAKQGDFFTQSDWSSVAQATTSNPTLSFDIDIAPTDQSTSPPYSLSIGNLSPGTVTTSSDKVWVSFSTNATNGGFIAVNDANSGLVSSTATHTINSGTVDLTGQQTGYGARAASTTQTSGGPMGSLSPYNGAGNNVGVLQTTKTNIFDSSSAPVTGGRVSFELKAKASNTTPSALDYSDTLTVLATGSF